MICWTQEYSVNNETLDEQHQELFKILNELAKYVERKQFQCVGKILTDLELYALFHFSAEENAMAKCSCPDLEKHKEEHEKFAVTMQGFKKMPIEESAEVCKEVLDYLLNWTTNHIKISDKAYGPYLIKKSQS